MLQFSGLYCTFMSRRVLVLDCGSGENSVIDRLMDSASEGGREGVFTTLRFYVQLLGGIQTLAKCMHM